MHRPTSQILGCKQDRSNVLLRDEISDILCHGRAVKAHQKELSQHPAAFSAVLLREMLRVIRPVCVVPILVGLDISSRHCEAACACLEAAAAYNIYDN